MGVSKVTLNGDVIMDITSDTVNQSNLLSGYSAHSANGEIVEGTLNIPTFNTQEKTVSPLTTTQSITPDQGFDGLSQVKVEAIPSTYINTSDATAVSGDVLMGKTFYARGNKFAGTIQSISSTTITPTGSSQVAVPAHRYTTGDAIVAPIPSTYVGPDVPKHTSVNLMVNGATVTAPSGYYNAAASAAVSTVGQGGIGYSFNENTGIFSAGVHQQEGYVAAGDKTTTYQLSTFPGSTITPTDEQQIIQTDKKYVLGNITIEAAPKGGDSDTSDATAVAANVLVGKTFYARGNKITGTMPQGSVTVPATTIGAASSIMVDSGGKITAITNSSKSITPVVNAGYIASGAAGTVTVKGTSIFQLSTQASTTIVPLQTTQLAVDASKFTTGPIKIDAIPSTYVGSAVPRFAERTIIPVEDAQTIATANKYMTGNIKISGIPTAYVGSAVPRQEGMSIIPTTSSQLAVGANKYTTGTITVEAIPNDYIIPAGTLSITTNGISDVTNYQKVDVSVENINNQNKTISPTESQQSITADTGYTGLGTVTVNAIPSTYVGSGIAQKTSSNLTVSGATVTAPAGYYANAATQSVTLGMAGAPITTKGTVSNNTMTVSSSVSNTTGYIIGGTRSGTSVTVKASELVSGTKSITENGNAIDVTNYANVNVNVPSNDFVINLEPNQNDVFEPDCTFAEAVAAYNAGKTIIFSYGQNPVTGGYDIDREWFTYSVYVYEIDENNIGTMSTLNHRWTSSGITQTTTASYYDLKNQNKTITPEKSQQSVTADTGYTGLGTVTMDPIPANYVQIKNTYLSEDLTINPSENTQIINVLDQIINSNPQYPVLTISNKVGTCNVSFSGLENNVPYLMDFMVAGSHNNQDFYNSKSIVIMFTNEITSINLNNFEANGVTYVDSAIITKSGNIIVNFNVDIIGSAYITLQYRKNNNNIIGYKYAYVRAIPTTYVGSGVTQRNSSDLTASGATVSVPAGYYANASTKRIASGTAGTPTATKGSVSNHSIDVTPSVTNTTGYITGNTKTGTAVTVTAAELVSGTSTIYENGTVDVTNLASVDISVYPKRTATITRTGKYDFRGNLISAVTYPDNATVYYTQGDTFEFSPSSSLRLQVELYQTGNITISVDGVVIDSATATIHNYYYVLPDKDIEIALDSSINKNNIEITTVESSSITVNPLLVTTSGTYTAPTGTAYSPVTVNISDSSELVYETGTWTPSTDIARGTITFAKTHTTRPFSIIVSDVTGTAPTNNSMIYWAVSCWYDAFETPAYGSNLSEVYGGIRWAYATTSSYAANGTNIHTLTGESNLSCLEYVMSETGFYPYGNASSYYWRAGRTYKWVAVWAPTT